MQPTEASTHYEVLGVDPDASTAAIKQAYYNLARHNHADKTVDVAPKERIRREEVMKRVNNAWEVLKDDKARTRYHLELGFGNSTWKSPPQQNPQTQQQYKPPQNGKEPPVEMQSRPKRRQFHPVFQPPPRPEPWPELNRQVKAVHINGWRVVLHFSQWFEIDGQIKDETPEKYFEQFVTLKIPLKKTRDKMAEEWDDVIVTILKTPLEKEVTTIQSLFKHDLHGSNTIGSYLYLTLCCPSNSPRLRRNWHFGFEIEVHHEAPPFLADRKATHIIMSRFEPAEDVREQGFRQGVKKPEYPPAAPEHRLTSDRDLRPLRLLKLGDDYYDAVGYGRQNWAWHRLAAVGYRYRQPEPGYRHCDFGGLGQPEDRTENDSLV
ncbi:hypothetical protein BDV96DRAFT_653079 [Lophiotrema nucula]|uniref:J domain-containing protein n=1 Tax=Lophiotrema nucula TaxID=690887 RepID=A0A6A5YLN8_9PLEO|nr:hypothetical protein BDV96DRAFT_653079 [Lophiotrema nucula]